MKTRKEKRERRKLHIRKNLYGTSEIPRVSVFRSNRYLYVQLVDDESSKVLFGMSEKKMKSKKDEKPVDRASRLGEKFGEEMAKKKIKNAVFDRSGYKYHGRVKALADGIRKSGIKL